MDGPLVAWDLRKGMRCVNPRTQLEGTPRLRVPAQFARPTAGTDCGGEIRDVKVPNSVRSVCTWCSSSSGQEFRAHF